MYEYGKQFILLFVVIWLLGKWKTHLFPSQYWIYWHFILLRGLSFEFFSCFLIKQNKNLENQVPTYKRKVNGFLDRFSIWMCVLLKDIYMLIAARYLLTSARKLLSFTDFKRFNHHHALVLYINIDRKNICCVIRETH